MTRRASIIATRQEIDLSTNFVYPPIPIRSHDWSAIDANTYDADWDYDPKYLHPLTPREAGPR